MKSTFERIAVICRGEAAMRLIHAVREYNLEHHTELRTIAFYSDPEQNALFVREADEALPLDQVVTSDGPEAGGSVRYFDESLLAQVLVASRAEAVFAGRELAAGQSALAALCERLEMVWIGPDAAMLRRLEDREAICNLAAEAGVAVAPSGDDADPEERIIPGPHRIEVQIIGDARGSIWVAGVCDCTLRMGSRAVLAESPSPALPVAQERFLREAALRIGKRLNYRGAGTVVFRFDPAESKASFVELNGWLAESHPLIELTSGLDLVKLQIHIARGGLLSGTPPAGSGHAIGLCLDAEASAGRFAPAPGEIERMQLPAGPGLRVDSGMAEGDRIPEGLDPLIARISAHGRTREEALARLQRALSQTILVIKGGSSNKGVALELLDHPEIQAARYGSGWLERRIAAGAHLSKRYRDIALMQAAIETYLSEIDLEKARFFASAHRGRPRVKEEDGKTVKLNYGGTLYECAVFRLGTRQFRVDIGNQRIEATVDDLGRSEWRLQAGGRQYRIFSILKGHPYWIEVNGIAHHILPERGGVVVAPAPAVVVATLVKPGDIVAAGDRLAVLEAMKTEMTISADLAGTVKQILVRNNMQVDTGAPLMLIEPAQRPRPDGDGERIDFSSLAKTGLPDEQLPQRCAQNMEALRCLILGFDADPAEMNQMMAERGMLCVKMPADDRSLWEREHQVLNIFVDIISLFRREPPDDDELNDGGRLSSEEYFFAYLRNIAAGEEGLPPGFLERLYRALRHYGVDNIEQHPSLELSLFRICKSHQRMARQISPVLSILQRRLDHAGLLIGWENREFRQLLNRMITETQGRYPAVCDLAREVRYRYFDQPYLEGIRNRIYAEVNEILARLDARPEAEDRDELILKLAACPQPLKPLLSNRFESASPALRRIMLEVLIRRYYRIRELEAIRLEISEPQTVLSAGYDYQGQSFRLLTTHAKYEKLAARVEMLCPLIEKVPEGVEVVIDINVWRQGELPPAEETVEAIREVLDTARFPRRIHRVSVAVSASESSLTMAGVMLFTYRHHEIGFVEEKTYRGIHPMMGKRLEIWRLQNFQIERIPTIEDIYLFKGVSQENPGDERLFAFAEVRDLTPSDVNHQGHLWIPNLEFILLETLASMRRYLAQLPPRNRLYWNRVLLYLWPPLTIPADELQEIFKRMQPALEGLGLEKVTARVRIPGENGMLKAAILEVTQPAGGVVVTRFREPGEQPVRTLSDYKKQVVKLRQRGLLYPYELIRLLTPQGQENSDFPPGEFVEYDLDDHHRLVPVERPYGENRANIIVGVITNFTDRYPEGMRRVALFGDPSQGLGALAEPECRRINAGLELARELNLPLEWYAISAGAKIAMDSGTENMDWIALVLRRIIEFTQAGGEINVVVCGINVGAQPYWNAEATMLMHTRGILVMTPESAMVLTGKQALEYSGGVAAEDNQGIGGYERIMGPNGQAQYFAHDLGEACQILFNYYRHSYVAPGERFPRKADTNDPAGRDVCMFPHGEEFERVGDIFSGENNPGRKKPFNIRRVMQAAIDQDHPPLERWLAMQDAEVGVIWDAHLGGQPVCLIGFESRPLPRLGFVPADGPYQWTAGTLFPRASKKIARAINAASNSRPLVVLANLSGFDGSPESLREWQLEFGAEIGRAVVNFKGPIVFCVISRYHGGAFVVFSNALNDNMEVAALEGSYASVIGGAPAAAVVFAREVKKRTESDPRLKSLDSQIAQAAGAEKVKLRAGRNDLYGEIYSEMLGQVAEEFDGVHSVQRALEVGSVNRIIPPAQLRPYLIEAVERGMRRELERELMLND